MKNRPKEIYRLTYDVPAREPSEPDTGYPGGDEIEGERHECVRYYVSRKSLNRKLRSFDPTTRVLSIEQASIDTWTPLDISAPVL